MTFKVFNTRTGKYANAKEFALRGDGTLLINTGRSPNGDGRHVYMPASWVDNFRVDVAEDSKTSERYDAERYDARRSRPSPERRRSDMSFTDQKPRIATAEDTKAPWGGKKNGEWFRCYLCGHRFVEGDYWRWVYGKETINFNVCKSCDGDDVRERFKEHVDKCKKIFWWWRKE